MQDLPQEEHEGDARGRPVWNPKSEHRSVSLCPQVTAKTELHPPGLLSRIYAELTMHWMPELPLLLLFFWS